MIEPLGSGPEGLAALRSWMRIGGADDAWMVQDATGKLYPPMPLEEVAERFAGTRIQVSHTTWPSPSAWDVSGAKVQSARPSVSPEPEPTPAPTPVPNEPDRTPVPSPIGFPRWPGNALRAVRGWLEREPVHWGWSRVTFLL